MSLINDTTTDDSPIDTKKTTSKSVKSIIKIPDIQILVCKTCKHEFRTRLKVTECKECRIKKGEDPYKH